MRFSRNDALFVFGLAALIVGVIIGKVFVWAGGIILMVTVFCLTAAKMLSANKKRKAVAEAKYRERVEQENLEREKLGLSRTLD